MNATSELELIQKKKTELENQLETLKQKEKNLSDNLKILEEKLVIQNLQDRNNAKKDFLERVELAKYEYMNKLTEQHKTTEPYPALKPEELSAFTPKTDESSSPSTQIEEQKKRIEDTRKRWSF